MIVDPQTIALTDDLTIDEYDAVDAPSFWNW
jgi:hypothetical protein